MNTRAAVLAWARQQLAASSDSAALDAEVLLMHVVGCDRSHLRAWPEKPLTQAESDQFRHLIERRQTGWPVAYLTGEREFWSRSFEVAPGVLIPRPETELLVELALERIPANTAVDLLDLGTGSGILAITLAAERPRAGITAIDASAAALAIAARNARRHGLLHLRLLLSDWFAALDPAQRFDLIISNPPYIAAADPHLSHGDLRHEPRMALASGAEGFDALDTLIAGARQHLKPDGWLLLEHGFQQAEGVAKRLRQAGYGQITHHADLQGHWRATVARYDGCRHPTPPEPVMKQPSPLILPRTLVNQILHLAQETAERGFTALIGARRGVPRSCHALSAEDPQGTAALAELHQQEETLFAVVHAQHGADSRPGLQPSLPRLVVDQDTRGVLELRGFEATPTGDRELELVLGEP